jgi:RNA 2',3'-cyclic 3'-phosphodiesterase
LSDLRARLFAALDLPDPARAALVSWRSSALATVTGLRPVAPEALHLTLCFLGAQDPREIEAIASACAAAAQRPVHGLSLGEALWLPARRPRVAAVGVSDQRGELARLQASLSGALQAGGWYEPEARPFRAHVTIARVARGERVRAVELPAPTALPLDGAQVTLYRSHLGRGGARYEALWRASGQPARGQPGIGASAGSPRR